MFTKMDNHKKELATKNERTEMKGKVIKLKVKFEWNVNGIMGEIADCGSVDSATIQETLELQPDGPCEGEFNNINELSDRKERMKMSQRK